MAGVPPAQQLVAAPPLPPPPWMIRGPNATRAPVVSGQPLAPQSHLGGNLSASGPLQPCPPSLDSSELTQNFGPPQALQPAIPSQPGPNFMSPTSTQFCSPMFATRQSIAETNLGGPSQVQTLPVQCPQVQKIPLWSEQQTQLPPSSQVASAPFAQQPPPAHLSHVFSAPYPQQHPPRPSSQLLSAASYSQQPQPTHSSQVLSAPYAQQQRPMMIPPPQPLTVPAPPGLWGLRMPSSSFTFATSLPRTQSQNMSIAPPPPSNQSSTQSQQMPVLSGSHPSAAHAIQNNASFLPREINHGERPQVAAVQAPSCNIQVNSDWQEHTTSDRRRYYYNKQTRQSSWEKPYELLTPFERADASTNWKEFTTSDGRKYYYNKVTKQSKWTMPEEMEIARKQAVQAAVCMIPPKAENGECAVASPTSVAITDSSLMASSNISVASSYSTNSISGSATGGTVIKAAMPQTCSSLPSVVPQKDSSSGGVSSSKMLASVSTSCMTSLSVAIVSTSPTLMSSSLLAVSTSVTSVTTAILTSMSVGTTMTLTAPTADVEAVTATVPSTSRSTSPAGTSAVTATVPSTSRSTSPAEALVNMDTANLGDKEGEINETSAQDLEEAKKAMPVTGKINVTPLMDEKRLPVIEEPLTYANKTEAKLAFKQLLESAHVESDWTWEQAMRVIINDKRYGALKSLAERRHAFNEYTAQQKKQEAEEKRLKLKRARGDFLKMLEECKELKSTTRWSKVVSLCENDPRFHSIKRGREREELFKDYIRELEHKERDRAREQWKRNLNEYKEFLASCDFIKANTQWRKVQDQLEKDQRCYQLDPLDRLEIFQEYVRELESKEEEERRIKKEQLRRKEHKNRDEFRKLLEEHKSSGVLSAKTIWSDYFLKVKDYPAYQYVASNTSGLTPKELFEDVVEELEKQYDADRSRIKDTMKMMKIAITSASTFDKFKDNVSEAGDLALISEPNLKLIFEELIEKATEKEEKEARKRQRLAEDFKNLLLHTKSISASSRWEDCKLLLEDTQQYRAIKESTFRRNIFDEYIAYLQQNKIERERELEEEKKKKEKERKKRKERKHKDKEHDREEQRLRRGQNYFYHNADDKDYREQNDDQLKGQESEKERKHKKHHHRSTEDPSSDNDDREDSKKSRKRRKKSSRKHGHESGTHGEHRRKRNRRDRDESRANGSLEHEDGEVKDDGEYH